MPIASPTGGRASLAASALAAVAVAGVLTATAPGGSEPATARVLGEKFVATGAGNNGCGQGNGGPSGNKECSNPAKDFTMSGQTTDLLVPGRTVNLAVTVTNLNSQPMQVLRITGTVATPTGTAAGAGLPACTASWVTLGGYRYTSGPAVVAPGNGTVVVNLPIQLTNQPVNQDACKGATFPIALTGSGQQAT